VEECGASGAPEAKKKKLELLGQKIVYNAKNFDKHD
jgi:hypothetical protein